MRSYAWSYAFNLSLTFILCERAHTYACILLFYMHTTIATTIKHIISSCFTNTKHTHTYMHMYIFWDTENSYMSSWVVSRLSSLSFGRPDCFKLLACIGMTTTITHSKYLSRPMATGMHKPHTHTQIKTQNQKKRRKCINSSYTKYTMCFVLNFTIITTFVA